MSCFSYIHYLILSLARYLTLTPNLLHVPAWTCFLSGRLMEVLIMASPPEEVLT